MLKEIEERIEEVRRKAAEKSTNEKQRQANFETEVAKIEDKDGGGGKGGKRAASTVLDGSGGADNHGDAMDIDEGRGIASRGSKRLGRVLGALRG